MHAPHTTIDGDQNMERPHCNPGCSHHKGNIGEPFNCLDCKKRLVENGWVVATEVFPDSPSTYRILRNLNPELGCGHSAEVA